MSSHNRIHVQCKYRFDPLRLSMCSCQIVSLPEEEMRKWRDLDDELLAKVFNLVDFKTRLTNGHLILETFWESRKARRLGLICLLGMD
jgi:hypothetical protein